MSIMKTLLSTCAIACILSTSALAFSTDQRRSPPPDQVLDGWFSCYVVQQVPRETPAAVISVHIGSDKYAQFTTFDVVHTMRNGNAYDRTQQYQLGGLQKISQSAYVWKGYRGDHTMVGQFYYQPNKRLTPHGWMYTEAMTDQGGRMQYQMISDCWPGSGEGD